MREEAGHGPRAVLLHGFSRGNRGDSLLVDLALDALRGRGWSRLTVVALWPETFADLPASGVEVIGWPHDPIGAVKAAVELRRGHGDVAAALADAGLVVGVGGGYLRASGLREGATTVAAHLPQLAAATRVARAGVPAVYLPQSVGPYRGLSGRAVRRAVRSAVAGGVRLFCRDDVSIAETGAGERGVDMALGAFGRSSVACAAAPGGRVVLVARDLADAGACYHERLSSLVQRVRHTGLEVVGGLSATAGSHNDDRGCFRRLGIDPLPLDDLFRAGGLSAVVSVRLHGALEAWLRGVPAVHLSYERKGPAAYRDLGVPHLCHDARRFDPVAVAELVAGVARAPSSFWETAERGRDRLAAEGAHVLDALPRPAKPRASTG